MGSDEAFEERDKSVSTPVSNRVGVPELDRLLNEVRYGVLDNSPERVDKASDAIRTLFTSIGSPETHSEREPDGWRPIETAPKDGTHVVVMYEPWFRRTGVATVAHYFEGGWHLSVNRDGENSEYKSATHWMPLPTLGTPPAVVDTTKRSKVHAVELGPLESYLVRAMLSQPDADGMVKISAHVLNDIHREKFSTAHAHSAVS